MEEKQGILIEQGKTKKRKKKKENKKNGGWRWEEKAKGEEKIQGKGRVIRKKRGEMGTGYEKGKGK